MARLIAPGPTRGRIAWTPLPFAAGWSDYAPATFQACQYGMDADGIVHLRGLCKSTNSQNPGTNSLVATLPANYRPLFSNIFTVWTGWPSVQVATRMDVQADGQILLLNNTATAQACSFLSLVDVYFVAEQ